MLLETVYDRIGATKADEVLLFILQHVDLDFTFNLTYDTIQRETGASQPTIARVFKALENAGAAKHVGKSKWLMDAIALGWEDKPSDPYSFYTENMLGKEKRSPAK